MRVVAYHNQDGYFIDVINGYKSITVVADDAQETIDLAQELIYVLEADFSAFSVDGVQREFEWVNDKPKEQPKPGVLDTVLGLVGLKRVRGHGRTN